MLRLMRLRTPRDQRTPGIHGNGMEAWPGKEKEGCQHGVPPNFLSVWRIFLGETLGNEMFGKRYELFSLLSVSGLRIYSYPNQDGTKKLFIEHISCMYVPLLG